MFQASSISDVITDVLIISIPIYWVRDSAPELALLSRGSSNIPGQHPPPWACEENRNLWRLYAGIPVGIALSWNG